jgi:hypothetical protein
MSEDATSITIQVQLGKERISLADIRQGCLILFIKRGSKRHFNPEFSSMVEEDLLWSITFTATSSPSTDLHLYTFPYPPSPINFTILYFGDSRVSNGVFE